MSERHVKNSKLYMYVLGSTIGEPSGPQKWGLEPRGPIVEFTGTPGTMQLF